MTKIEWTHREGTKGMSWNPIKARRLDDGTVGWTCTKESPGCAHCYAEGMNLRFGTKLPYTKNSPVEWFLDEKVLEQPLYWRQPRTVFVCSMTDLFHDDVPDEWIVRMFHVMHSMAPRHTYQVLTKRPHRMHDFIHGVIPGKWHPLGNIWLGVTAEDQDRLVLREPSLMMTPTAVRFLSVEPMLGPVHPQWDWESNKLDDKRHVDWVIIGCESGPKRRPCNIEWVRDLVQQCKGAGVACFVKQLNINGKVSKNPEEWPDDLRVREYPR